MEVFLAVFLRAGLVLVITDLGGVWVIIFSSESFDDFDDEDSDMSSVLESVW